MNIYAKMSNKTITGMLDMLLVSTPQKTIIPWGCITSILMIKIQKSNISKSNAVNKSSLSRRYFFYWIDC
jgi:hypothetical protein